MSVMMFADQANDCMLEDITTDCELLTWRCLNIYYEPARDDVDLVLCSPIRQSTLREFTPLFCVVLSHFGVWSYRFAFLCKLPTLEWICGH